MFRAFGLSMIGLVHPKMLWLSLRPFLFVSIAWGILFFFIWEPTLEIIRVFITTSFLTAWIADVMSATGWDEIRAVMAPLLLVMVLIPLITISLLVFVAFTSIPAVIKHLSKQTQYQSLHQANAGGVWGSIVYALISIFICFFFLLITLPIWWIPPMVAILPPLLWGWLTMRLMSYDVLALHASAEERDALIAEHRWRLLAMGIISGLVGAVPTFFWATSAIAFIFFPIVSFFALWIYSLVFIFSALWFAHYLLNALREYRMVNGVVLNDA
ncbi:EI24 domain-containing protein [Polynucleobacter cosmopolitanus]|nr:EI24 domain-containing protein [Polynucleobacter cosmopolitanus]